MRALVSFPVVIVGSMPNGSFRVHAAGCRDIQKDINLSGDQSPMEVTVSNKREVADYIYGPQAGSFYEEAGGDEANGSIERYLDRYAGDSGVFDFAPCIHDLPAKPARDTAVEQAMPIASSPKPKFKPLGNHVYRMRVDLVVGQELTKAQVAKVRALVAHFANANVNADDILGHLKAEFYFTARTGRAS